MTERAQKLKAIVKGTAPQATYGTNPRDPWSAKANMSEDAALNKYLMSRGINPKYATKDQKVAHSKTNAFITWKNTRMLEDTLDETVDKKDTVTLDIPLLIRVLELAREDIKTDMDLHRVVEKLINIRTKGMLTMKDYNYIAKIHEEIMSQVSPEVIEEATRTPKDEKEWDKVAQTRSEIWRRKQLKKIDEKKDPCWKGYQMVGMKKKGGRPVPNCVPEEVEPIDEISKELTHSYFKKAYAQKYKNEPAKPTKLQMKNRNKGMNRAHNRLVNRLELPKGTDPSEGGKYTADSVEHDDEVIVEMDNRTPSSDRQEQRNNSPEVLAKKDKEQQERLRGISPERRKILRLPEPKESVTEAQSAAVRWQKALEAAKKKREEEAARNAENAKRALAPRPVQEADCGCDDVPAQDKNKKLIQMSKSARIIKSIYKKQGVKEETYDHEKEDKSVATYGKKPKIVTNDPKASFGEKKPDAAAVLSGGTTLTGQKRDTVEIDPMMRKRPSTDSSSKNK